MQIDWETYLENIDELIASVRLKAPATSHVVGSPTDGIFPALCVAEQLGLEFVDGAHAVVAKRGGSHLLMIVGYMTPADAPRVWGYVGEPRCTVAALYTEVGLQTKLDIVLAQCMPDDPVIFPYSRGGLWR